MTRYRTHLIEFTSNPDRPYEILHDHDCEPGVHCTYAGAAGRSCYGEYPKPPGRYRCHVNWSNGLEVAPWPIADRWADPPTIEKPWTMGDLREWIDKWGHIPDDMPVTAYVPQRPRSWAHTGDPLYANTLHGLSTEDPEDFE